MAHPGPKASKSPPVALSKATTTTPCDRCPDIEMVRKIGQQRTTKSFTAVDIRSQTFTTGVTILFPRGDEVRDCANCRAWFSQTFQIPESWWSTWCRRSNGFFGAEDDVGDDGKMKCHNAWFRFLMKRFLEGSVEKGNNYVWYKFNVFIHWDASTKSTCILVFDPRPEIKQLIVGGLPEEKTSHGTAENISGPSPRAQKSPSDGMQVPGARLVRRETFQLPKGLTPRPLVDRITETGSDNPYSILGLFLEEVVYQQDEAVWGIRDLLRNVEKTREQQRKEQCKKVVNPKTDFDYIHDVARHAIHVSETLEVAIVTVEFIKTEHEQFLQYQAASKNTSLPAQSQSVDLNTVAARNVRKQIAFSESKLRSLRFRAMSNMDRLKNEIQLAFNTVAQYDSEISIDIGRAAQSDSAAMKTIAFLTLIFLPPTFISSLFSMSFFNFDAEHDRWRMSSQFWIFWAVTIPITILTATSWVLYWKLMPPPQVGIPAQKKGEVIKEKLRKLVGRELQRADTEMTLGDRSRVFKV